MKDNKKLRCGYTTGSCAAAAAQRAAALLLGASLHDHEDIVLVTPKGVTLQLKPELTELGEKWASCSIQKDAGDDPDITNGILVCARVSKLADEDQTVKATGSNTGNEASAKSRIVITGGDGVGRVTKPGLACSIGEAAINPVPKAMILEQVKAVCDELDYAGSLLVEISVPQGSEIAKRTYNPRLGIVGGISILGTSGIVEPMSEQALIDTIKTEMNVRKAEGAEYLVITPGNYGETFLKKYLGKEEIAAVKCSNFIGEALDYAEEMKFKGVLLTGHIGKLIKTSAGIMNTHSKYGDARMEILTAHAALAGAPPAVLKRLMECVTTEDAITVLDEAEMREITLASVLKKLDYHIKERVHHQMEIGAVIFSNFYGYLGETVDAAILKSMVSQNDKFCMKTRGMRDK
ncbi:cobalamin biosynthesis protein CbiD [Anoxybacterium hadale]|uniref:Cobalamin biosynthesis protein CbiD n=2 Tax=Anoxybacterium hadale TaxID=3408580 RepID=A0ACD1AI07_9FIRM|nr:cobalamin biosynthesis protein CbiD [Clostridiales bacterium]